MIRVIAMFRPYECPWFPEIWIDVVVFQLCSQLPSVSGIIAEYAVQEGKVEELRFGPLCRIQSVTRDQWRAKRDGVPSDSTDTPDRLPELPLRCH